MKEVTQAEFNAFLLRTPGLTSLPAGYGWEGGAKCFTYRLGDKVVARHWVESNRFELEE